MTLRNTDASLCPPTRNSFSCKCKFAADVASLRVLTEHSLRSLEGLLESGHDLPQLLGSHVLVTSKSSSVPPLEVEREWMIRP